MIISAALNLNVWISFFWFYPGEVPVELGQVRGSVGLGFTKQLGWDS